MNKILTASVFGFSALTLTACQQLVETPTNGAQSAQIVNPLGFLSTPLASNTTTTTTTEKKPRLANGRKNFGTTTTTTVTTTPRTVTSPVNVQAAIAPTANQQVIGSQAVQVKTTDGRTIILYPGQTYYGPDGRLYVYDPNSLPVVTTGF